MINVKDLEINKYALDEELQKQALLYEKWSRVLAEYEEVMYLKREKVDLLRAELDAHYRSDKEKKTENAIANMIVRNPKYQKEQEKYIKAKREYAEMRGAVDALSHKKSSLENLVKLYTSNYWSDIEKTLGERKRSELTTNKIKEEMNKKGMKKLKGGFE